MKKKIIFSMSCIALLSILLSMVLSGVVSYYDSLEIVKKATIAESRYIQNGIALGGDDYLSDIRSAGYDTAAAQSVRVTVIDTEARCDLTVLQMPQTWKTTTTARRSLLQEKTVRGNPCVNPIR